MAFAEIAASDDGQTADGARTVKQTQSLTNDVDMISLLSSYWKTTRICLEGSKPAFT